MRKIKIILSLICFAIIMSCSKSDDESVTFSFTYTFHPDSARGESTNRSSSTSFVNVSDANGNDIGGARH